MALSDQIKQFVEQGMAASKDILGKMGDKAQQWGELGVLKMEILQLRSQSQKLTARLGAEVYETLVEKNQHTVSKDSPAVRDTIARLQELESAIDEKETTFKEKGGKTEDLKDDGKDAPRP